MNEQKKRQNVITSGVIIAAIAGYNLSGGELLAVIWSAIIIGMFLDFLMERIYS